MTDQRNIFDDLADLFDLPAPSNKVDTSDEAAEAMQPVLGPLRWAVLEAVCEAADGLTTFELERHLKGAHQTISPRVWEMTRKMRPPLLVYSKDRRQSPSGRGAHVIRPTEEGWQLYRQRAGV